MDLCPTFQVNQTVDDYMDDTTFPLNDTLDVKTTEDYNLETIMQNLEKGWPPVRTSFFLKITIGKFFTCEKYRQ